MNVIRELWHFWRHEKKMGSVSLNSIPNEIVGLIFEYADLKTLCVLPLVCKNWRVIASSDQLWLIQVNKVLKAFREYQHILNNDAEEVRNKKELYQRIRLRIKLIEKMHHQGPYPKPYFNPLVYTKLKPMQFYVFYARFSEPGHFMIVIKSKEKGIKTDVASNFEQLKMLKVEMIARGYSEVTKGIYYRGRKKVDAQLF